MPIYDFRCRKCSHVFWKVQNVSAGETPPACPGCGCEDLEKLISNFNTQFYTEAAEEWGREMMKEMPPGPPMKPDTT